MYWAGSEPPGNGRARRRRAAAGVTATVGHEQRLGPGRRRLGGDGGFADRGVRGEGGLDLAGLDAEAADLDLAVGPSQVLADPVGAPARQVAGAVEPFARLAAERVGHEALGGQLRPPEIAPGEVRSRRSAAPPARPAAPATASGRRRRCGSWRAAGRWSAARRPRAPPPRIPPRLLPWPPPPSLTRSPPPVARPRSPPPLARPLPLPPFPPPLPRPSRRRPARSARR